LENPLSCLLSDSAPTTGGVGSPSSLSIAFFLEKT
jgi:hypothetical protein